MKRIAIALLACGCAFAQPPKKNEPRCSPNDRFITGNIGGSLVVSKCDPVSGKMVPAGDLTSQMYEDMDARLTHWRKLWFALRSRVLTAKEMEEVEQLGTTLFTREGVSYNEAEQEKILNDALFTQFKMRLAAEKGCGSNAK